MSTAPPLLERAVGYALAVSRDVPPGLLSRETPCQAWDLSMLLAHANESLAALAEGIGGGRVALYPPDSPEACEESAADPLATFRRRVWRLPSLWADAPPVVTVADRALPADLLAAAGALEIAVHGWDIARACHRDLPIPAAVAVELLAVGAVLAPADDRYPYFAPPRTVGGAMACPSDRLVAFLGRDPG